MKKKKKKLVVVVCFVVVDMLIRVVEIIFSLNSYFGACQFLKKKKIEKLIWFLFLSFFFLVDVDSLLMNE